MSEVKNYDPILSDGTKQMRSILIVDKNPLLAEVLAKQLNQTEILDSRYRTSDCNLVAEVTETKPDVLIIDPTHVPLMKHRDITDLGRSIRQANKSTRILGYTFQVSQGMVRGMLDAGFRGCISKDATYRQLEIALAVLLDGGVYFDKEFGAHLRPSLSRTDNSDGLSEREKEVLIGLARGLSSKRIAQDLNISNKTVDTYKSRASQKLDISDREKLVKYVMEKGWIN